MAAPEIEFTRFRSDVYDDIEVAAHDGTLYLTQLKRDRTRQLVATGPDTFATRARATAACSSSATPAEIARSSWDRNITRRSRPGGPGPGAGRWSWP
jgi:hypothetical protein